MAGQLAQTLQQTDLLSEEEYAEAQRLVHQETQYQAALIEAFSFGYSEHYDILSERSIGLFGTLQSIDRRVH